jgi:ankyrin repeat protein
MFSAFHEAAQNGQLDLVNLILEQEGDKNPVDGLGETPLHWAAQRGHLEVVKAILEKVCDNPADNEGKTPLHWAALRGHLEVVKAILEKFSDNPADNDGQTPLHLAAEGGHLVVVKAILEKVSDNPADNKGITPLHWAAQRGHLEVVKAILEKVSDNPADINSKTPLHWAAQRGHLEVVKAILEKVSDNPADNDGWTPLHWAAEEGHLEVVKAILEKVSDNGNGSHMLHGSYTPLQLATRGGHHEVVKAILEKGSDNPADNGGETPLHLAAATKDDEVTEVLYLFSSKTRQLPLLLDLYNRVVKAINAEIFKRSLAKLPTPVWKYASWNNKDFRGHFGVQSDAQAASLHELVNSLHLEGDLFRLYRQGELDEEWLVTITLTGASLVDEDPAQIMRMVMHFNDLSGKYTGLVNDVQGGWEHSVRFFADATLHAHLLERKDQDGQFKLLIGGRTGRPI